MLVTTCQQCDTTFKITDEILEKAGGQVRCGRCANIFNARTTLREQAETETRSIYADDEEALDSADTAATPAFTLEDEPDPEAGPGTRLSDDEQTDDPTEPGLAALDGVDDSAGDTDRTAEFAELAEPVAAHSDSSDFDGSDFDLSEDLADDEAQPDEEEQDPTADTSWLPALQESDSQRRWPYRLAALLLILALAAQGVHEFRESLMAMPRVGAAVASVYGYLGVDVAPRIDIGQYELLDLSAVAQAAEQDQGWLVIETRIRNNGPRTQPAPYIFVALLDRWQDTIAGRYFGPQEYAINNARDFSAMTGGDTIDAQFIIVDPGPGATGFELEICTPIEQTFACDGDATFN